MTLKSNDLSKNCINRLCYIIINYILNGKKNYIKKNQICLRVSYLPITIRAEHYLLTYIYL